MLVKGTLDDLGIKISDQNLVALHANDDEKESGFSPCFYFGEEEEDWTKKSHIPYQNIIWCEPVTNDSHVHEQSLQDNLLANDVNSKLKIVQVTYLYSHKRDEKVKPLKLQVEIDSPMGLETTGELTNEILSKAYTNKLIKPSLLILINPFGGQGHALRIYHQEIEPILKASNAKVTLFETQYGGHAIDIARELLIEDYDVIVCCSGDGIPYEVINGFYQRKDYGIDAFNKVAITQLPCGSGNALSLSTHGTTNASLATFKMLKAERAKLDLMAVTQGIGSEEKTILSFLSQCYGIIADSDIGTEHLRWMGSVRFEIGVIQRIMQGSKYPCDLYIDYQTRTKDEISKHFQKFTKVNNKETEPTNIENFKLKYPKLDQPPPSNWIKLEESKSDQLNIVYVGKMPYISSDTQFFPAALPNDGNMDLIMTDSNTSLLDTTKFLLNIDKGSHVLHEKVDHFKIRGYRLVPRLKRTRNHYVSIDGENFPIEPFQVEVLPGIMTGLLQNGMFVDTCFTDLDDSI